MAVKLIALTCANCGGSLDVPAKVAYVTCEFCGTRLHVQRTGNAVFAEVVGDIARLITRFDAVAGEIARLKLLRQIDQIDRQWEQDRKQYMDANRNGSFTVPSSSSSFIAFGFQVILFFVMAFVTLPAGNDPGIAIPSGMCALVMIFGMIMSIRGAIQAYRYEAKHQEYVALRQHVVRQLDALVDQGVEC